MECGESMGDYIYLICAVVVTATLSIFGNFYNKKTEGVKDASTLYTLLLMGGVFAFWLVSFLFDLQANVEVIGYSLLFATFYTLCNVGLISALRTGPLVLTSLLLQLSTIGIGIWSFIFWGVSITPLVIVGLVLVIIALCLCLWTGKSSEEKINPKWILYVLMVCIGNAGCGITQRTQQMRFDGKYGSFLMLVAMGISFIISLVAFLRNKPTYDKKIIQQTGFLPVLAGISNGLSNLFVIVLATSSLSPSLIYPVIAIGGLMLTTICSAFIFKEKMHWWQWVGVLVGSIAVGVLSI